jgi:hypothetical protein
MIDNQNLEYYFANGGTLFTRSSDTLLCRTLLSLDE